ncbi:hypothetical protein E2C01_045148 [Portunus trituberculatus]|uniref:Uncharacterized protein n=1 Tax=Portunus trituberculatus TaxID=210409 RepID=A0A5B7G212_PORTR|nr:hypothetical protein [Portunus trituberculatus]
MDVLTLNHQTGGHGRGGTKRAAGVAKIYTGVPHGGRLDNHPGHAHAGAQPACLPMGEEGGYVRGDVVVITGTHAYSASVVMVRACWCVCVYSLMVACRYCVRLRFMHS